MSIKEDNKGRIKLPPSISLLNFAVDKIIVNRLCGSGLQAVIPAAQAIPLGDTDIGVDSKTKAIHSVVAIAANVADCSILPDLLRGQETRVWGDQAHRGQRALIRQHAPKAKDFTNRRYRHRGVVDEAEKARNRTKPRYVHASSTHLA